GSPFTLLSEIAEHTRNARVDPRASLLVVTAIGENDDPMAVPRVTLCGQLELIPAAELLGLTPRFFEAHPFAESYASFEDFAWWRLAVESVRFVGGYGRMSWIDRHYYRSVAADPIAPHA